MGEKVQKNKDSTTSSGNRIETQMTESEGINQVTQEMYRESSLNKMKQTLEIFESSIISDVQQKMDGMIEEIIQQVKRYELNANEFKDFALQQHQLLWSNRIQKDDDDNKINNKENKENTDKKKHKKLSDKVFTPRNSYLTCLLEVTHMKSIYHIFLVILTVLFLHTIIHDFVTEGKINIGINTIIIGFGKLDKALIIWAAMQLSVFGVYYAFKLWAVVRYSLRKKKQYQSIWNYICVTAFIFYQYYMAYVVSVLVIKLDLALITSLSLLMEMVRFMMKTHAFVRTSASMQLAGKQKTDDENDKNSIERKHEDSPPVPVTKFSKYLYFLFAPTLVFREEYPRTKVIRWNFVAARLTEVLATMFFQSYFFERFIRPTYQNFGKAPVTPGNLMVSIFNMMMPGLMIFLSSFYVLLHAWLNATAEMLRFADRMFYKDWWTCRNYDSYYRNWNVVVHDWLYEYIYKDCYKYIFKGSKSASALTTFFISAVVHEYILAIGLRFVFPFLFFNFAIFSVCLTFLMRKYERDFGNFILWLTLGSGNGIIISFYAMEYYARQNCPIDGNWYDYVIPRLLSCNGIVTKNQQV